MNNSGAVLIFLSAGLRNPYTDLEEESRVSLHDKPLFTGNKGELGKKPVRYSSPETRVMGDNVS